MADYVLAIDQGTTSTRAIIFNHSGQIVETGQLEHEQILPRAGWVEHDPLEIWRNTREVVGLALSRGNFTYRDIAAVGITNQRETAVVWDKTTGEPVYNAIVWQDTRTQAIVDELGGEEGADKYKAKVGLPLATYFSGPKIKWILDNVEGARAKAEAGDLLFGNTDTWTMWNMTGGVKGGIHITDVTNASRTMLMDLSSLSWDESIAADMGIPMSMLPEIRSSSEVYGEGRQDGPLQGVPIAGILGDQQAATFGQACFEVGMAKNTYGTGNFMLINTGTEQVPSENGIITTVCYKIGDQETVYALEGSIAARTARCRAYRSPGSSETNRPQPSVKRVSRWGWRRTPTAPGTSCSSTPVPSRSPAKTASSRPSATRSVIKRRCTPWKGRSPSPAPSCSGCGITSA